MCLVLALDIIRKIAQSEGHAVGPVLVLSYKNHALDEFLLDVKNQYESSNASNFTSRFSALFTNKCLRPGMLIRTGKPDIDSLNIFTERFSPLERDAQDRLAHTISVKRQAELVVKTWSECARNLESKSLNDVSIKHVYHVSKVKNLGQMPF